MILQRLEHQYSVENSWISRTRYNQYVGAGCPTYFSLKIWAAESNIVSSKTWFLNVCRRSSENFVKHKVRYSKGWSGIWSRVQFLVLYRASADAKSSWSSTAQSGSTVFDNLYTPTPRLRDTRNSWLCGRASFYVGVKNTSTWFESRPLK